MGQPPTNNKVMGFLTDHPPLKILPSDPSSMDIPHIDTETNNVSMSTLPRHPQDIPNLNLQSIQENLNNAINQAENIPNLYNHHILFRLSARQSGGRYITPRHITKFIYNLAQVKPDHSLADFACGSGGFLVERELTVDNFAKTWGIDISPDWIRLAYANIALRKLPPQLRSGNALDVETFNKLKFRQTEYIIFDRILMNPPFGATIDSKLALGKLGKTVGSRSETALTTLAIQQLADDGIAAILVPSGLLFSNSKAERELRQTLIDEYHLKAVITLPKDALQPYSSLQSHILLIHKPIPPLLRGGSAVLGSPQVKRLPWVRGDSLLTGEKMTWFFQLEKDGYSSGRSRDLTQKPDVSKSDFPFVEKVFNRQGDEFDYFFPESHSQLGVKIIKGNENQLLGFVIEGLETTDINSVTFYPQANESNPPFLLVDTIPIENQKLCIRIPLADNQPDIDIVENPFKLIQDLFKPKKNDPDLSYRLYSTAVKKIAISERSASRGAIYPDTMITKESISVLGVLIQSKQIIDKNYDLRPEEYINKQTETRLTNSPVELLTRIYTNQRQLTQNLETLFSRIELPPITTQSLSYAIADVTHLNILTKLNPQQQAIWERIQSQITTIDDNNPDSKKTARHFTLKDLKLEDKEDETTQIRSTLVLLEKLGIIVPVTFTDPNPDDPILCYRRIMTKDLWQFDLKDLD